MYQSHASYSDCGLGHDATDRIVELARHAGPDKGIYGAKITGGGSGGTVAILGRSDAQPAIDSILEKYTSETTYRPYVFSGTSDGAVEFGVQRAKVDESMQEHSYGFKNQ
jgi:L-arabinokinase